MTKVNGSESVEIIPNLIDNCSVYSKRAIDVINPRTGERIEQACGASRQDAGDAVDAAERSFIQWSQTHPAERRQIFLKAADIIRDRQDELKSYMAQETGASEDFAAFNIKATVDQVIDVAGRISGALEGSFPVVEDASRSALVLKEPYGVVLGIAPWNAPYVLGSRAFLYALAAGNTAILKGSELSPRCFHALVQIFLEAGLPRGALNLLIVHPEDAATITEYLISRPAIGKINFTGSSGVGSSIAAVAGKYLKPVVLELGGKATAIVLEDADLAKAAKWCATGGFLHTGQVCMGTERIAVHASVATKFQSLLGETINQMFSTRSSVLISAGSAARVAQLVDDAKSKGAEMFQTSVDLQASVEQEKKHNGAFFRPTVLSKVPKEAEIYYAESFGPVVSIHIFETEDDALNLANDTRYGLAGAIFTENLATGLRLAKRYTTGAVHINSMSIHDEPVLPHGGSKESGFGRFNASYGLNEFMRTKVVTWEN